MKSRTDIIKLTLGLAGFTSMLLIGAVAHADVLAQDSAADPIYNTGLDDGMNGGSGFGPWVITQELNSGRFVGDSNQNGFGDVNATEDVNTTNTLDMGVAWGLYASMGNLASAVRPLNTALKAGDTLSFSIDNGFIDGGGTVGVGLQNEVGENLLELYFTGGAPAYTVSDDNGTSDTTIGFTSDGLDVTVELLTASTYDMSLQVVGGAASDNFQSVLSTPASGTSTITQIRFFNFNAGAGATNDFYFNKLQVDGIPDFTKVEDWIEY